jgi:predicted O-linked N-acetylglucosamine transferase (SPINDLY family)
MRPAHLDGGRLRAAHDRDQFRDLRRCLLPLVTASPMRAAPSAKAAFSRHFVPVHGLTDKAVAALMREANIGHRCRISRDSRKNGAARNIWALRPAPLQVSYLPACFPGNHGGELTSTILIADRVVVPEHEQKHYSEKLAYLPPMLPMPTIRQALLCARERRRAREAGFA